MALNPAAVVLADEGAGEPLPPQAEQPLVSTATLDEAVQRLEEGDFDKAVFLFQELRDRGLRSRIIDIDDLLKQAMLLRAAEEQRREARGEYELIVMLARHTVTRHEAQRAWVRFRDEYADFDDDPEGLAAERTSDEPAPTFKPFAATDPEPMEQALEPTPAKAGARDPSTAIIPAKVAPHATDATRPWGPLTVPPKAFALAGAVVVALVALWAVYRVARDDVSMNHAQSQLSIMADQEASPDERAAAGRSLGEAGDPRRGVGLRADGLPNIAWVDVPGGTFTMGSEGPDDEKPVRQVSVEPFRISKYETTFAQYKAFLDDPGGYANDRWWNSPVKLAERQPQPGYQAWPIANHPAENVSWYDAMAFCRWLTARLRAAEGLSDDLEARLPTEEEWEKAARGTDGREYPWGEQYISGYANIDETGALGVGKVGPHSLERTTAVGIYPRGASPFGGLDMSGNVWEWTLTEYESRKSNDLFNSQRRVLRSGSWLNNQGGARATDRNAEDPFDRHADYGFRVVLAAPIR